MPQVDRLKFVVQSPTRTYDFGAEVHAAERPEEQRIDADFYEKYEGRVHQGTHHELLLFQSPAWGRVDPEVAIHVYQRQDTGEKFVCYTRQVETLEGATGLFQWWCVGMVYSLENKADFRNVLEEHPEDFLEVMDRDYGIRLVA